MRAFRWAAAGAVLLLWPAAGLGLLAGQDFSKVEIETTRLADGVFMLAGAGGNIGVCAGADGVFLIDDQYAPITEKIQAAVAAVSREPVRFVLNTHWHFDHTGGNENLGRAGAVLLAHDNVRARLSADQFIEALDRRVPASPAAALPKITFATGLTFHLNGDEIRVVHAARAHTDGDSIVVFEKANVVHMGDTYFNGLYPFIDVSTGGSIDGVIAAVDQALGMIGPETKVIPGHGRLSNRKELEAYRDMLAGVRAAVAALVKEGKSRDEAVAAKPTARFDAAWGRGFLTPDQFAGIVYDSVKAGGG